MDPTDFVVSRKKENLMVADENEDDVENYSTLRTVAATLLEAYSACIDGTIPEIFNYVMEVLKNGGKGEFPTSLLLMLLGILRDPAHNRKNGLIE